jgi:hypothetical protein
VAGSVGDAVIGVRGAVVKKLCYFNIGGGGGCSLFGANFTERMDELVINGMGVVEEGIGGIGGDVLEGCGQEIYGME